MGERGKQKRDAQKEETVGEGVTIVCQVQPPAVLILQPVLISHPSSEDVCNAHDTLSCLQTLSRKKKAEGKMLSVRVCGGANVLNESFKNIIFN